ncbi:methyltransferase domain-containing protein [Brucellaceae bacterium C25G]
MSSNASIRDPYKNRKSIEFSFRAKRFLNIRKLIEAALLEKGECEKVEILDLGGSEKYWLIGEDFITANRHRLHFTLVNVEKQEEKDTDLFTFLQGDATDPSLFADRRFDLVHSNSVIEHVGNWDAVERFANNVQRLGKRYYTQAPNYWFPLEPHFRFLGFQWLPIWLRVWLLTKMRLGFFERQTNAEEARFHIESIRLMSARDMQKAFPFARIEYEKVFGLTKSIMAISNDNN